MHNNIKVNSLNSMKKYVEKESRKETIAEIKRFCLDLLPLELPTAETKETEPTSIQKACLNSVIRKLDEMLNNT